MFQKLAKEWQKEATENGELSEWMLLEVAIGNFAAWLDTRNLTPRADGTTVESTSTSEQDENYRDRD